MTYNVGALNAEKLILALHLMRQRSIDVGILTDTQTSAHHSQFYKFLTTSVLGQTASFYDYPCPTNQKVGGIAMITNAHITHSVRTFSKDATGLGILATLEIQRIQGNISIIGVYAPCPSQSTGSFSTVIRNWCTKHNLQVQPYQHVINMINHRTAKLLAKPNHQVIVTGDLNASKDGTQGGLNPSIDSSFMENWKHPCPKEAIYTNYSGVRPTGWIDHILLPPGPGAEYVKVGVATDPRFAHLSSHRPYYVGIATCFLPLNPELRKSIAEGRKARKKLGKVVTIKFNHKDSKMCNEFLDQAIEWRKHTLPVPTTLQEAHDRIHAISHQLPLLVQSITGQKKKQRVKDYRHGWSPIYIAFKMIKKFAVASHRNLYGEQRYRIATCRYRQYVLDKLQDMKGTIKKIVKELPAQAIKIVLDDIRKAVTEFPLPKLADFFQSIIKQVVGKCHYHQRRFMRSQTSERLRLQECAIREGKVKYAIDRALGKYRAPFDLSVLQSNGTFVTMPKEIHSTITEFFQNNWFHVPQQHSNGIHEGHPDYDRLLRDYAYYRETIAAYGIPEDVQDRLWKGFNYHHATPAREAAHIAMKDDMLDALEAPPSLDEVQNIVKTASQKSAPGVSGLTYAMLNKAGDGVLKVLTASLGFVWRQRTIPEFWRQRWLQVIPKVQGSTEMSDLRPIMLIEITRKLMIKVFMKRVNYVWKVHSTLSTIQSGGRANFNTTGPSIQLQAVLEQAMTNNTPLYGTSYDIEHAFDSTSRNFQMLGWIRLGLPVEWAKFIVDLEEASITMVKTPYAEAERNANRLPLYFSPRRGSGQGDIPAGPSFGCGMDILFRASEENAEDDIRLVTIYAQEQKTSDLGFVDDYINLATLLLLLQFKADLVCAFCIIVGFDIKIAKLRTFCVNSKANAQEFLTIHTTGWIPHKVPIQTTGSVKYLGSLIGIDLQAYNAQRAQDHVTTTMENLSRRTATPTAKALALRLSVMAQVSYYMGLTACPLRTLQTIEQPMLNTSRKILYHQQSTPRFLIQGPQSVGGLNTANLVDTVQLTKLRHVFTMLRGSPTSRGAMESMLQRFLPTKNSYRIGELYSPLQWKPNMEQYWLTSVLHWLSQYNLNLVRGGLEYDNNDLTPLLGDANTLERYRMGHIGHALSSFGGNTILVRDDTIRDILPEYAEHRNYILPGQFWLLPAVGVVEILAFSNQGINVRLWTCTRVRKKPTRGDYYTGERITRGATTGRYLQAEDFADPESRLFFRTCPNKTVKGDEKLSLIDVLTTAAPRMDVPPHMSFMDQIPEVHQDTTAIYADGSWTSRTPEHLKLFFPSPMDDQTCTAGVVTSGGPRIVVRVPDIRYIDGTDNYLAEAIGLVVACMVRRRVQIMIYTDCQSIVDKIVEAQYNNSADYPLKNVVTVILRILAFYGQSIRSIAHVKGHPERRKSRPQWNTHDIHNHLADRTAAGEYGDLDEADNITELSYEVVKSSLMYFHEWFIQGEDGPLLIPIKEHVGMCQQRQYLANRESIATQPYRWTATSIQFAIKIWKFRSLSSAQAARVQRILFDKLEHGRNVSKYAVEERERLARLIRGDPIKCPRCQANSSLEHILFQCQSEIASNQYHMLNKEVDEAIFCHDHGIRMFLQEAWSLMSSSPNRAFLIRGLWLPEDAENLEPVMRDHDLTYIQVTKPLLALYTIITNHISTIVSSFPFPRKETLNPYPTGGVRQTQPQPQQPRSVHFKRTHTTIVYRRDKAPSCISHILSKAARIKPREGVG